MALTINVGLTRKLGTPNYGSIAASCAVEFQLESGLQPNELEGFHRQVRNAYAACRDAVLQELARQQQAEIPGNGTASGPAHAETPGQLGPAFPASSPSGNGQHNGQANGHAASEKQIEYLRKLAHQVRGLGVRRLDALSEKMFDKSLAGLTSHEASRLIDTLKDAKDGEVDLDAIPGRSPAAV